VAGCGVVHAINLEKKKEKSEGNYAWKLQGKCVEKLQ